MSPSNDKGPFPEPQEPSHSIPPPAPPAYTTATTSPAAAPAPSSIPLPPLSPTNHEHERTLPSLSSVTGDQTLPIRNEMAQVMGQPPPSQWTGMALMTMPVPPPQAHKMDIAGTTELDGNSTSATSAASPESRTEGRSGSVNLNLDDPDVRLAAEALGDLRAG